MSHPFSQVSLNDSVIKNDLKEKCLEEIAEEDEFIDDLEEDDLEEDDYEEDNNIDLNNPSCYANINGISIFFTKQREDSVSGLLSINNIIEQQKFKEEDVKDALLLWSSIDDLKNLLLQENLKK